MLSNTRCVEQELAPALIESVKTASLVLIADLSTQPFATMPEGIDGYFKGEGVLRFNQTVDI